MNGQLNICISIIIVNYFHILVNLYPLVISFASSLKSGNSSAVISVATFLLDVSTKYFIFSISFFDADMN